MKQTDTEGRWCLCLAENSLGAVSLHGLQTARGFWKMLWDLERGEPGAGHQETSGHV